MVEAGFVPIGGIEQWVSIRGENRDNPAIVIVHGGPGVANSAFQNTYQGWEKCFTVIQWDQRGAGKTFGRSGGNATPGMTLDRMVAGRNRSRREGAYQARKEEGDPAWSLLGVFCGRNDAEEAT